MALIEKTSMERVVNISKTYQEADEWDIEQCLRMTYAERQEASRVLKARLHPDPEDIRDCLRDSSIKVTFRKTFRS